MEIERPKPAADPQVRYRLGPNAKWLGLFVLLMFFDVGRTILGIFFGICLFIVLCYFLYLYFRWLLFEER